MKPTRAVVPLAGLGTRLYPMTKAVPKALLPIPGPDGALRPAIEWIVREVVAAGIEEIVLVVSPREGEAIRRYFTDPPALIPSGASGDRIARAWNEIAPLGRRLTYAVQQNPGGFGHAVLQAAEYVGGEPFLLCLGDHLYRSRTAASCSTQVIAAAATHGAGVLGVRRIPERECSAYGVVGVVPEPVSRFVYRLHDLIEKPSPAQAHALRLVDTEPPLVLVIFGIYLLPGSLMSDLAAVAQTWHGELDLSAALRAWFSREGGLALEVQGEFFDVGTADGYKTAFKDFPRPL